MRSSKSYQGRDEAELIIHRGAEPAHLERVLEEIKDGTFVKEWTKEWEAGYPTLKTLLEDVKLMPLQAFEERVRKALHRP